MTVVPRPRVHASRLRRVLAAPLAIWTLVAIVLAGRHLADGTHARRADGSLVHVGVWVSGLRHAACDRHSPTSTIDRDDRASDEPDVCWLVQAAPRAVDPAPASALVGALAVPGSIPHVVPRGAIASAVLMVAPKTSPPA